MPPTTQPRYRWQLLRAATFKLDAGSMFGLIPRVVWSKSVGVDAKDRITVQHNCLLLTRADATAPSSGNSPAQHILLEVGSGNKLDPKTKSIFDLQERWVGDALNEINVTPQSIQAVICSHLHFDHAGGLTRLPISGETPGPLNAVPSFPNATIIAQQREWEDALANNSVMTRTYFRENLEPITPQLKLITSPYPFASPAHNFPWAPSRDADPGPVTDRLMEVLPGIHVFSVPGHTWGQQATMFTDDKGRTVVFVPDVMPTLAHLGAAYSLAYDVEPYTSMLTKHWLLAAAADNNWLLALDHEPGNPICRVKRTEHWFELIPDAV